MGLFGEFADYLDWKDKRDARADRAGASEWLSYFNNPNVGPREREMLFQDATKYVKNPDVAVQLQKYAQGYTGYQDAAEDKKKYNEFSSVAADILEKRPSQISDKPEYNYSIIGPGSRATADKGPVSTDIINALMPYGQNPSMMRSTIPAKNGAMPTEAQTEADLKRAGAAYNIGPDTINKEIDNARLLAQMSKDAKAADQKEWNPNGALDEFLVLSAPRFGGDVNTSQGRQKGIAWLGTAEGNKAYMEFLKGRREATATNFNYPIQSQFVDPETGVPLVFDRTTGTYRRAAIEGGGQATPKPAAFTPESAAKTQLIEQGLSYLPEIRKGFLGEDGKTVDRVNVANNATRMVFTEGRRLNTLILDAVEAKLRAESGAAVPDTEVTRSAKRFIPQVGDSDATIVVKLNNLEKFLQGTSEKISQGRPQPNNNSSSSNKKADPLGIR